MSVDVGNAGHRPGGNDAVMGGQHLNITPGGPVATTVRRPNGQVALKKLSVNLLNTYNVINQVYYAKKALKKKKKRNHGYDDENHDYIIKSKEKLAGRYVVDGPIGKGSFGAVCRAYDEVNKVYVAIKIVKSKPAFFNQAQIEMKILNELSNHKKLIVSLIDSFVHHNHQCLVFELLSFNLYELLRDTNFFGVSLNLIRKFGTQLLETLECIKHQGPGIIHCDLKPENILLQNSRHSAIKVIDFGSACFQNEKMYTYIQSRFYRSPEVMLGLPYTTAIDMWSLGCILVEMHTGKPLFNGSHEREQMVQHVSTLGYPPSRMLDAGKKTPKYFVRASADAKWRVNTSKLTQKEASRIRRRCKDLEQVIGVHTHGPDGIRKSEKNGHTLRDYTNFLDLIKRMLEYDPAKRVTPAEALEHPFFRGSVNCGVQTSGSSSTSSRAVPMDHHEMPSTRGVNESEEEEEEEESEEEEEEEEEKESMDTGDRPNSAPLLPAAHTWGGSFDVSLLPFLQQEPPQPNSRYKECATQTMYSQK